MKKSSRDYQLDFKNRRALVTGAGKGIGREIAVQLHRFNAQVVAVARTESDLRALKDEIGCETIIAELGDPAEAKRAAEEAGDIDLLVNNAAIAILQPFLKTTVEAWDATMAVNLRAIVIISQIVAARMIVRNPSITPRSGVACVVSTLTVVRLPPASSARSVKVPPISTARRADLIRFLG